MAAKRHECSICIDVFTNPKLLPCSHTFCVKCLEDYVRVNLRNGRFNCPLCRETIRLPAGGVSAFKANFYMASNPSENRCDQHLEEEIRLYCQDCKTLICQQCIAVSHDRHAIQPVSKAADEELFNKVQSILSKLNPQNFQTCVAEMQALEINTEACLKNVVDLVFEKAISEPGFSVAYANMCKCLSMYKVSAESKQGDVNFRALLLTRCQREFEKANSTEKESVSKRKEIEKATTEEQKQQTKEELEDEESKAKRRSLGNIRFIGELFKLKMLTENIMHDCVFKLLRTKDEENLESLCTLLKTIGKELDTDKAKRRMDQYFVQMQRVVNEKKLSSSVLFMLQGVIELRQGKWVPRRDDNNPKTIDQIHREVAQEAQDRAIFVQTLPQTLPQTMPQAKPEEV